MSSASRRPPKLPPSSPRPIRTFRSRGERSLRTLGVLLLLVVAVVVWQAFRTRQWLPAQGTVAQVETRVAPFFDLRRFGLHFGRQRHETFTYRFEVGGRSYEGQEDGPPLSSRLVVYYDPADPSHSMIGRPRLAPALAASAVGIALLAVGFWLVRRARRRQSGALGT